MCYIICIEILYIILKATLLAKDLNKFHFLTLYPNQLNITLESFERNLTFWFFQNCIPFWKSRINFLRRLRIKNSKSSFLQSFRLFRNFYLENFLTLFHYNTYELRKAGPARGQLIPISWPDWLQLQYHCIITAQEKN